jgi:hypothetical protein
VSAGRNQSDGEIKLYDHEAQKVASILKKSRNPNLFDGHTNKGMEKEPKQSITEYRHALMLNFLCTFFPQSLQKTSALELTFQRTLKIYFTDKI